MEKDLGYILTEIEKFPKEKESYLKTNNNANYDREFVNFIHLLLDNDVFDATYKFFTYTRTRAGDVLLFSEGVTQTFFSIHEQITEVLPEYEHELFSYLEQFRNRLEQRGYLIKSWNDRDKKTGRKRGRKIIQVEEEFSFFLLGNNDNANLRILLDKLILADKVINTSQITFNNAFTRKKLGKLKKRIIWKGTVSELKFFVNSLFKCQKIAPVKNKWQIAAKVFIASDEQEYVPEQFKSNTHEPSNQFKEIINRLIAELGG